MKGTTQTQLNMKDLTRRQIRYICFRLQNEAEGLSKAIPQKTGVMQYVDKIKEHMEEQDDFGGWKMFAKTWDVDEKSPLVVIKRTSSIYTDWNKILKKGAKDMPTPAQTTKIIEEEVKAPEEDDVIKNKTTPQRDENGKFISKSKKEKVDTVLEPEIDSTEVPSEEKKSFWNVLK